MCVERSKHVHPLPHPTLWQRWSLRVFESVCPTPGPAGGPRAASTSHTTSPSLTAPHTRPLVSARHPTLRQQGPIPQSSWSALTPRATYLVRVHRVTAAPAPSCVERVVHVAATSSGGGCEPNLHALRVHTALFAVGRCLAGCVCTGCTAESSRVDLPEELELREAWFL
jgi:hypothetical protein